MSAKIQVQFRNPAIVDRVKMLVGIALQFQAMVKRDKTVMDSVRGTGRDYQNALSDWRFSTANYSAFLMAAKTVARAVHQA